MERCNSGISLEVFQEICKTYTRGDRTTGAVFLPLLSCIKSVRFCPQLAFTFLLLYVRVNVLITAQ